ncbi:DUF2510 domain-containing protein [Streptomyces sp. RFCAC02]|uniref:DUF2510 domain-containing protein n=1 Tax=Streptomyces sp. RFCAC02 TaxID=2499143 RepID=UPI0010211017|nr:DUF2510 domain-containing protein [Streptomyces sp. RFCAC02]
MATPAGWYRDPGYAGPPPEPERWWDGREWTATTRPGGAATAPQAAVTAPVPAYGGPPAPAPAPGYGYGDGYGDGQPAPPAPAGRRKGPLIAALAVVVALAAAGTTYAVFSGDDEDGGSGEVTAHTSARVDGIALPLIDGWEEMSVEGAAIVTTGQYPCPEDPGLECQAAGASLTTYADTAPDLAQLATADATALAENSYSQATYGEVSAPEQVLSEPVTVAGVEGHRVRVHVTTESGIGGLVETVAFPAPTDRGRCCSTSPSTRWTTPRPRRSST